MHQMIQKIIFPIIFICLLITIQSQAQSLPIASFIPGTNRLGGNDGVVLITYPGGTTGTICNQDFSTLNAQVLCYLLGYTTVGLLIPSINPPSPSISAYPVAYNRMNCTSRVDLNDPTTFGRCAVITNVNEFPTTCNNHANDVAVACSNNLRSTIPTTVTTLAPVTLPSINCSSNSTVFRFNPLNNIAGRLEYNYLGQWGTVCIEGMDTYAAKLICQLMCAAGSATSYSQARVVTSSVYGQGPSTQSILMSGISCKANSQSFSDCQYVAGSSGGCSHSQDAGVECQSVTSTVTAAPVTAPILSCTNSEAIAYFLINTSYAYIDETLVTLYGGVPLGCAFNATKNNTYVVATIPYSGCNGTLSSNSTYVRIQFTLLRNVNPVNGVLLKPSYTVGVSCFILRNSSNSGIDLSSNLVTIPPVENIVPISLALTIYNDFTYTQSINPPLVVAINDILYVKVNLTYFLSTSMLILQNLWATSGSSLFSTDQFFIIQNKCATNVTNTKIIFYSATEVRIEFPMFLLQPNSKFYLHASGYICNMDDNAAMTSPICFRTCGTNNLLRKRRSLDELIYSPRKQTMVIGPIMVIDGNEKNSLSRCTCQCDERQSSKENLVLSSSSSTQLIGSIYYLLAIGCYYGIRSVL